MATGTSLGLRVARRVHDEAQAELSAADYLDFLNDAVDDLVASGWLEPMTEDESLTLVANDYDYTIPASFAYISHIYIADADGEYPGENEVPQNQWRLSLDTAGAPEIYFMPDAFDLLIAGRAIKLVGQKRPSQDLTGASTITAGMEAFIRERAVAYAAENLSAGVSELSQVRMRIGEQAWARSERMLGNHPMEFRVIPSSRHVPGR